MNTSTNVFQFSQTKSKQLLAQIRSDKIKSGEWLNCDSFKYLKISLFANNLDHPEQVTGSVRYDLGTGNIDRMAKLSVDPEQYIRPVRESWHDWMDADDAHYLEHKSLLNKALKDPKLLDRPIFPAAGKLRIKKSGGYKTKTLPPILPFTSFLTYYDYINEEVVIDLAIDGARWTERILLPVYAISMHKWHKDNQGKSNRDRKMPIFTHVVTS